MKKGKLFSTILYIVVLVMTFSFVMNLFGSSAADVTYSELVALFENEQVKSFVVDGKSITLLLHGEYEGRSRITTALADPEGFRESMWQLLQEQSQKGILESYDFVPEKSFSPYQMIIPIVVAGLILIRIVIKLVNKFQ